MALITTFETDEFLLHVQNLFTRAYGLPRPGKYTKVSSGLINQTFDIDNIWILQQVNGIFGPQVNEDIAALTPVLLAHGVPVPSLCRTLDGTWYTEGAIYSLPDGIWRVMTKLQGETFHSVNSIEQIRELTRMLAGFHRALDGFGYTFKHVRSNVHDFYRHRQALDIALEIHKKHRLYAEIDSLNQTMLHLEKFVSPNDVLGCEDMRIIHGDPKISNFLFNGESISGVIDLDTMAKSRLAFDVGDAVRSWCNPRAEDVEPQYNREFAREMMGLYLEEAQFITKSERVSLKQAAPLITLELAMRFARDALCEDYFGFNPAIGHGEHSLLRARSMTGLCGQMLES